MAFKQGQYITFISEIPNSAFPAPLQIYCNSQDSFLPLIGDEGKVTKRMYGGWYKIYLPRNGNLITIRNGNYMDLKSNKDANSLNNNKQQIIVNDTKYEEEINGEDHLVLDLQQENEALKIENLAKKNFIYELEKKLSEMQKILSDYEYQTNVTKEKLLEANEEISILKKENNKMKMFQEKNVLVANDQNDAVVKVQKEVDMIKKLIELNFSSVPWYDKNEMPMYDDHN